MKDIDEKQAPEVSGGYRPGGPGCTGPYGPWPVEYPKAPTTPVPEQTYPDPIA